MKIINMVLVGLVALASASVQAKALGKIISCPSIDMIHKVAPLMTEVDETAYSTYLVQTPIRPGPDNPTGQIPWFIMSFNIAANSSDEAIKIAQNRGVSVTSMVYPNARRGGIRDDEYSCLYYDNASPNPFAYVIAVAKDF